MNGNSSLNNIAIRILHEIQRMIAIHMFWEGVGDFLCFFIGPISCNTNFDIVRIPSVKNVYGFEVMAYDSINFYQSSPLYGLNFEKNQSTTFGNKKTSSVSLTFLASHSPLASFYLSKSSIDKLNLP